MQLNSITTWNTKENRDLLLRAAKQIRDEDLTEAKARCDLKAAQKVHQVYHDCYQAIEPMGLPELVVLDWDISMSLFGSMYPDNGIYMEPHKHQHLVCGCITRCPWPDREEACQAIEHWDKRCDKCFKIWWDKYGKAENEHYWRANPPKYIHDHTAQGVDILKCTIRGCRNFGKTYNGHETWSA